MNFTPDNVLISVVRNSDLCTLLLVLRPTSTFLRGVVDEEIKLRQEDVFAFFARDRSGTRRIMRTTDAVVAGSLALSFFAPIALSPASVDIFVPVAGFAALRSHFIDAEDYVEVLAGTVQPPRPPLSALAKASFSHYGGGVIQGCKLRRHDVVLKIFAFPGRFTGDVAPEPISTSWSTLLMNFVAPDYACSAYPSMTLRGRGLFHYSRLCDASLPEPLPINRYTEAGFEFARHPSTWYGFRLEQCPRGPSCPFTLRCFGDDGCLQIGQPPPTAVGLEAFWVFGGVARSVHE